MILDLKFAQLVIILVKLVMELARQLVYLVIIMELVFNTFYINFKQHLKIGISPFRNDNITSANTCTILKKNSINLNIMNYKNVGPC